MRTVILLLSVAGQLIYWDLLLKMLKAASSRAARRYVDAHVSDMAHRLLVLTRFYGGLTVDLDDRLISEAPSPTLVCANHQSVADIVVLLDAFRSHQLRFVAKKELGSGFPAVSAVLRIQGHALISRTGDFRHGTRELHRLGRETRIGVSPAVFPEGTRSRDGSVKTFHAGAVRTILAEANVPLTAVAVDGGHRFVTFKDLFNGLSSVVYRAKLVGVFPHDGSKAGVTTALDAAHDAVVRQLDAWRREDGPSPYPSSGDPR